MGHVRDLPGDAKEIPAKYKGVEWARLGVNVDNDFEPLYVVSADKKAVVRELKDALAGRPTSSSSRPTKTARARASPGTCSSCCSRRCRCGAWCSTRSPRRRSRRRWSTPRDVDDRLVRAQETRRILDRLVGYTLSPLLWKKIACGLSAGRVQSVAMRLLVVARARAPRLPRRHLLGPGGRSCGTTARRSRPS